MRLLTWNINHRTRRRISSEMAGAIGSLAPGAVVLTEYVAGPSHDRFLDELGAAGLTQTRLSPSAPGQNRILVASRAPLRAGEIEAPAIAPAFPSNVLHLCIPRCGIEILGLRIPDFSRDHALRRECWDWLQSAAGGLSARPSVILGDFNTDPAYPRARCGDRFARMEADGWLCARPEGSSYWTLRHGLGRRLDHALVSPHLRVRGAAYVRESGGYLLAGPGRHDVLSDHAALLVEVELAA